MSANKNKQDIGAQAKSFGDVTLLDCTLRDGGYYTDWNFTSDLVEEYLAAMGAAGVDKVELGYRFLFSKQFLGPFAYCSDEYLSSLPLPDNVDIGVMVDAKQLNQNQNEVAASIDLLFRPASESPISFVRVAANLNNVLLATPAMRRLKELGYETTLNLMQVGGKSLDELIAIVAEINSWGTVDILYFADSFGNMNHLEVGRIIERLKDNWSGNIGVHFHDNMSRALQNTVMALDMGAQWIDGTVTGIGRGAGNAATELILLEFIQRGATMYDPEALFPLVMGKFAKLRDHYHWGPNLLYYLSAMYSVHPMYIQEMLSEGRFDPHEVILALSYLKESDAASFTGDNLQLALLGDNENSKGSWSAKGWASGRDVLVIGSGPGIKSHLTGLIQYVESRKPVTICLNVNSNFPPHLVSAYATCHKTRFLMELEKYKSLQKPLIVPIGLVPDKTAEALRDADTRDFGLCVTKDRFSVTDTGCEIPMPIAAGYALAVAVSGGANRVLMAGFDGYAVTSDMRHQVMEKTLEAYRRFDGRIPLLSVTPTTYSMEQASIYDPRL